MYLQPLQQWSCDACGAVISTPSEGRLEWDAFPDYRGQLHFDHFRILHAPQSSDLTRRCAFPEHPNWQRMGADLNELLGIDGLIVLLDLLSRDGARLGDLLALVEVIRRVQVPHYELARVVASARTPGNGLPIQRLDQANLMLFLMSFLKDPKGAIQPPKTDPPRCQAGRPDDPGLPAIASHRRGPCEGEGEGEH